VDVNKPVHPGQPEIADIAARAQEAKERLQQVAATATSRDGAATVTVNVSGALQQLVFGPKADQMSRGELAASVLATAHRAQAQAAQQLTAVMAPLIGGDSDAMKFLEEQIPTPDVPEEEPPAAAPQWNFTSEERTAPQRPAAPTPPPPPAPAPRPARQRPASDEDDDYYGDSILHRGF
jgi:DNA-binding protein YbaB